MTQKQCRNFCLLLIIIFSVVPNFFFYSKWLNFGNGYGIVWFVTLYFLAAYIKRYVSREWLSKNQRFIRTAALISIFSPFVSRIIIVLMTQLLFGHSIGAGLFFGNNTILCLTSTLLVFLSFLTFEIKGSSLIKWLSAGSFSVYLISDNFILSKMLWDYIRPLIDLSSPFLFFIVSFILLSIYLTCSLIDIVRQFIQNMFFNGMIDRFSYRFQMFIQSKI